jgi:hypothetical protein
MFTNEADDINIGDIVKVVHIFDTYKGSEGVVIGIITTTPRPGVVVMSYNVYLRDSGKTRTFNTGDIKLIKSKLEEKTGCSCGAIIAHGSVTRHSYWCGLFKEYD